MSPFLRTTRAGFTLIELMMAIAVMAILIMVAAPYFRDLIMNVRLTGQANDLFTDLMYARSEATKRDVRVTVCARAAAAALTCNPGTTWVNGWLVVVDANGDGNMDTGTIPLKVAEPLTGQNTLVNSQGAKSGSIVFTATGLNESGQAIFSICDSRQQGRLISVAPTGRPSVSKLSTGCK